MPSARPADDVRSLPLEVGRERPWQQLVHDDLADMLMDLLTLWSEICRIDRALEGRAVLDRELAGQVRRTAAFPLASDVDHAARLAAGIFVAYILLRSEEHTSELQSLMRISYAVFCLKKKNNNNY